MKSVELLAPAGNMIALHAAVSAGADAVYLGASSFNARRSADNFTLETLREACDYAHLRGVKVYLTVNTIILPSELYDALELVRQAYRAGVDAFIVQDLGLAQEIARTIPQTRVHISTQMNTHTKDALVAEAALGAKRVTLARELSLTEVADLSHFAAELGMETECFAHGALCVCYSGQCFMSSMVGGRSANRGMCAQACRLPYELRNRALRKSLDAPGEHLLSPKDLCTAEILPDLIRAGVSSLKVEGRMKSPEYVSCVVRIYRSVLDRFNAWASAQLEDGVSEENFDWANAPRATAEEIQELSEAFSRGFTTAYLEGERGNEIMSYARPNNRGSFAGRIANVKGSRIEIDPAFPLVAGDVLEFWTNKGNIIHEIDALETLPGGRVVLKIEKPLGKGDRVFRVRSAEAAFHDVAGEPRIPLLIRVKMHIGHPLELALATPDPWDAARKVEIFVEGAPIEPARTKAVSAEEVIEHIDRLGSTPSSSIISRSSLMKELASGSLRFIRSEHRLVSSLKKHCSHVITSACSKKRLRACSLRESAKAHARLRYLPRTQLVPALQNALEQISSMCLYIITVAVKPSLRASSRKRPSRRAILKGAFRCFLWLLMMAIAQRAMALTFGSVCRKTSQFSCRISGRSFMHVS